MANELYNAVERFCFIHVNLANQLSELSECCNWINVLWISVLCVHCDNVIIVVGTKVNGVSNYES